MRQPHRNIPTLWKVRYQLRPNIITRDTPIYSADTGQELVQPSTTNELVEAAALQQIHNAGLCEDFTNGPMRKSC